MEVAFSTEPLSDCQHRLKHLGYLEGLFYISIADVVVPACQCVWQLFAWSCLHVANCKFAQWSSKLSFNLSHPFSQAKCSLQSFVILNIAFYGAFLLFFSQCKQKSDTNRWLVYSKTALYRNTVDIGPKMCSFGIGILDLRIKCLKCCYLTLGWFL